MMKFHILTLFPEMVQQGLATSILGRAAEKNLISIDAVNIRDYTQDKHGKVDDYTYGGGAGMLMQAQPVYDAYRSVAGEKKIRCVYLTPQGEPFTQKKAKELSGEEELVLLCGHYEGIDERVLEEVVTDYISIGDYVLTGGELAAMVVVDAVARLVPGVLNNDESAETESFHNDLLEYPQYSRPEVWHGRAVPPVLLSGHHGNVDDWRKKESYKRTMRRRPDMFAKFDESQLTTKHDRKILQQAKEELRQEQDGRVRCSAVRLPEGSFARAMQLLRYLCENSVGLEQWLEVLTDVGQSYELLENAGTAGMIPDFAGDNLDFCAICRF